MTCLGCVCYAGKGAFGRVLLAEAKTDGKLYALKIISKKNMGQGDRRQAMAERDILHSMSHTSPHPFTTGLAASTPDLHHSSYHSLTHSLYPFSFLLLAQA